MIPKCTSWRGHKFEARYSKALPNNVLEMKNGSAIIIEAMKTVTYERDVCVRCGHVVEKSP